MSDRQDEYSMMSFRPSSYSTGIQPVQPYTPIWPEGTEYGSYLPDWLRWGEDDTGARGVGGTCKNDGSVPNVKVGDPVSCAALKAALEGKPLDTYDVYEPDDGMITDLQVSDVLPDFILPDSLKSKDYCDEECQRKKKMKKIVSVAVPLLAVAGFLGWRYHTTGKIV